MVEDVEVLALLQRHRGRAFCDVCIAFLLDADIDAIRDRLEELEATGFVSRAIDRCAGCGAREIVRSCPPE